MTKRTKTHYLGPQHVETSQGVFYLGPVPTAHKIHTAGKQHSIDTGVPSLRKHGAFPSLPYPTTTRIELHHYRFACARACRFINQIIQQGRRRCLLENGFGGCQDHAAARICRSVTKIALRRLQSQCSAGCGQQRSTRSEGQCPRNQAHRGASPPSRRSRVVDTTRASHPAAIVALLQSVSHSHCLKSIQELTNRSWLWLQLRVNRKKAVVTRTKFGIRTYVLLRIPDVRTV